MSSNCRRGYQRPGALQPILKSRVPARRRLAKARPDSAGSAWMASLIVAAVQAELGLLSGFTQTRIEVTWFELSPRFAHAFDIADLDSTG